MPVVRPIDQPPSSWLVPAVLSTLCLFPITGVVAVYYAAQVRLRWDNGDFEGAEMAARRARLWTMIAVVVFLSMVALLVGTGSMVGFVERIRE